MAYETKTTLTQATISTLQELIQINLDSRDGFREVAGKVENMTVSELFQALAEQRNEQASELSTLVAANAEIPENSGSTAAAVHRAWIDLRSAFGGGVAAMLSEAERGEDYIKDKYEEAIRSCAGSAVSDILNRHYRDVKLAHDRVRDLRDEFQRS